MLTQSLKIVAIVLIGVVSVAGAIRFFEYWQDREPTDVGRPVVIQITEEDDSGSVAEKLADADLINFTIYFETRMRFEDVDLRPGVYTLRIGMSVPELIDAVTVESVATGDESSEDDGGDAQIVEVTLIEGQRAEEFGEAIEAAGYPNGRQVFMDALMNPSVRERWDFLDGVPADANLNGFLFPDTYRFTTDYTGEDIVDLLLRRFDAQVTSQTRQEWADQGLSVYEGVTLASIVEREAVVAEERPLIAAVYLNRLDQDPPILNADPTSQYAVGQPGNWWPAPLTTEQLHVDSPYNTYDNAGLPPGPISNPGIAALQSVGKPADVDYLYFFALQDGSGEHVFALTYEEHQQNVCAIDPAACEGAGVPGGVEGSQASVVDRRFRG